MKKKLMLISMVIALVTLLAGGATFAFLTDTASNSANTFVSGTVDIDAYRDGFDTIDGPMFYTTAEEGMTPDDNRGLKPTGLWAPGDTVVRSLVVHNEGNLDSILYKAEAEQFGNIPAGYTDQMQVQIFKIYPAAWGYPNTNGDSLYLAMNQDDMQDVRTIFNDFVTAGEAGDILQGYSQDTIEQILNNGSVGNWFLSIRCAKLWEGTLADLVNAPQEFSNPVYLYSLHPGADIQDGALLAFVVHMDQNAGNAYQGISDVTFNFDVLATQQKNNSVPLQP